MTVESKAVTEPSLAHDRNGLAAWFATIDGPVTGALMFRVGTGDEPLTRRGYTHLIEHLTLHDIRNPRLQWNGFVDLNRTVFHATGDQSDVEEFLHAVSRRLHDVPEERLLAERQVLAAEARSRGMNVGSELLSRRFGATGWGSAGWWEVGIPYAEPGDLTDWMRRGFGRRNAAMWMTCPPSGSLLLDLPDGSSLQLPSTTVAADGRAWFRFRSSAVAFLIRARRSYAATLAANVLTSELHRRLRDAGLCYSVSNNWSRLTPDMAAFTVSCDSVPDRETQLAEAVLTIVDDLADRPPDEALATVRSGRTLAQPDDVTRAFLDAFAHDHLLGRPRQSISSHLAEEDAVAIDDVAREIRQFRDDLLMAVPEQAIVRRADMPTYPDPPRVEVGGKRRRYATFFERSDSSGYLAVDDHGMAFGHASGVNAVRWDDVNCVMRWDDGTRCAISNRGDSVLVEPTRFVDGAAAIDVIDASIPDEASVRIGHRYGPPVLPWAPERSTKTLRVARWLISWVLLVTTYVLAFDGPWVGAAAAAPFCALVWWSIRTTRRPSPHIWDNSNTRRNVPETVDRSAWYVPTGLLFGWLIERDHLTPHWRAALAAEVDEVAARSLTGPGAYRRAGGILTDDMLTAEANEFLSDFLEHFKAGRRLSYEQCLRGASSTSNWYEIPDTWSTQEALNSQVDKSFRHWRRYWRWSVLRHLRRSLGFAASRWRGQQASHWPRQVIQRWRHRRWS
jgi:hypothetical protein